ncbi:hypothetical protein PbB2_01385 [Candidatus Phycosocius bacilliformis]|uniref:Uncharacterized protein n=1 Tax=Candidatus Phycosocius bacilliformis TaxID=1445552 RepID=A0A2P2E9H0_9PROT|nr:hypothetical protein PbB2_01385 [Candidatus Phycosocius bacilliformis]
MRSRIGCAVQDDTLLWMFISTWNRFGESSVSPKRMVEFEGDIWVVKCRFSSKTDRTATQQSCALDHPGVARTIEVAVWWPERAPKRFQTKTHSKRCPPRRSAAQSGDLVVHVRSSPGSFEGPNLQRFIHPNAALGLQDGFRIFATADRDLHDRQTHDGQNKSLATSNRCPGLKTGPSPNP